MNAQTTLKRSKFFSVFFKSGTPNKTITVSSDDGDSFVYFTDVDFALESASYIGKTESPKKKASYEEMQILLNDGWKIGQFSDRMVKDFPDFREIPGILEKERRQRLAELVGCEVPHDQFARSPYLGLLSGRNLIRVRPVVMTSDDYSYLRTLSRMRDEELPAWDKKGKVSEAVGNGYTIIPVSRGMMVAFLLKSIAEGHIEKFLAVADTPLHLSNFEKDPVKSRRVARDYLNKIQNDDVIKGIEILLTPR